MYNSLYQRFFPIICVSMLRKIQIFFSCWLHFSESVCLNLQFWISAICNVTKSSGASDNSLRSLAPPAVRCLIQPLRIPQSLLFSSKREAYNKTSVLTLLFYTKLLQSCCCCFFYNYVLLHLDFVCKAKIHKWSQWSLQHHCPSV